MKDESGASKSEIGRRRLAARRDGGVAYQKRRENLIRTAAEVFKERGYQDASLGDVAAALGTDRASLYYYVSSKRELFEEVIFDAMKQNVLEAERIRDSSESAPEKVRNIITSLMSAYERHYPYLYVYVQEDLNRVSSDDTVLGRELRRLERRYDAAVTQVIKEGVEAGELQSDVSPAIIAYGIIGMLNWSHRWFQPTGRLSGGDIGEALGNMVIRGLVPPTPSRRRLNPA